MRLGIFIFSFSFFGWIASLLLNNPVAFVVFLLIFIFSFLSSYPKA